VGGSIANVGQCISGKRAQTVCIYFNGDTFKYHCAVSGLALRPHRKPSGREQTFSNFIFGRRASRAQGSSERENLLRSYTSHAGRKSRYKQQHIARRMHQLSVAACPLLETRGNHVSRQALGLVQSHLRAGDLH